MRFESAILRFASIFVPAPNRADWLAEWNAEVWHIRNQSKPTLRFILGAFPDAIWLRRNDVRSSSRSWLHTPFACAGILAVLAAAALQVVPEPANRHPLVLHLGVLVWAVGLLPIVTTLPSGKYPPGLPPLRRRLFLIFKIACLLAIVFGLMSLTGRVPMQPHGLIVGYILAIRWALVDQQNRCPVCLCRLTNPTTFGNPSQTLLEWYGTELTCPQGHGLLHVPEIPSASYSAQTWLRLDPSWKSLFVQGASKV